MESSKGSQKYFVYASDKYAGNKHVKAMKSVVISPHPSIFSRSVETPYPLSCKVHPE